MLTNTAPIDPDNPQAVAAWLARRRRPGATPPADPVQRAIAALAATGLPFDSSDVGALAGVRPAVLTSRIRAAQGAGQIVRVRPAGWASATPRRMMWLGRLHPLPDGWAVDPDGDAR